MPGKPAIAFIGTGVMGRSMAGHLLAAGHALHVHNRTREKARALLDAGAHWHDSAGDAAAAAEVVVTMLGFPRDVEESYLAPGGIVVFICPQERGYATDPTHVSFTDFDGLANVTAQLHDTFYGSRDFAVKDPEGHSWFVGTYAPWQPPRE